MTTANQPATKKPPLQGPRAKLPALPDVTLQRGETYQCTDEDTVFYLAIVSGMQRWRRLNAILSGNSPLYIDVVNGNDANSGESPSQAIQTIDRLLRIDPAIYRDADRVFFAPGTYPWPNSDVGFVALAIGPTSESVAWIGGMDSLTGSVALSAASVDGLTLQFPKGTAATGDFDQLYVEFLDGNSQGVQAKILTSVVSGPDMIVKLEGSFSGSENIGTHVQVLEPNVTLSGAPPHFAMNVSGAGVGGSSQAGTSTLGSSFITSQMIIDGHWQVSSLLYTPDRTVFKMTNVGGFANLGARIDSPQALDFMPPNGVIDGLGCLAAPPPAIGGSLTIDNYSKCYLPLILQNVKLVGHTHSDVAAPAFYGNNAPVEGGTITSITVLDYADAGFLAPSYSTGIRTGNQYRVEGAVEIAGTDFDACFQAADRSHWPGIRHIDMSDNDLGAVHAGDHSTIDCRQVLGALGVDNFGFATDGSSQIIVDSLSSVAGTNPAKVLRLTANARAPWAGGVFYSYAQLAAAPNKTLNDVVGGGGFGNQGNCIIQSD